MTPRRIFDTMGEAMRSGVIVATVLAASGLIVASMSRTGFALAFSSTIINLSGGYLRSEEHTSELQSRENLVCRLLLEKKDSHAGSGVPMAAADRVARHA